MSYTKDKKIVNLNSHNASDFLNGTYLSNVVFSFQSIVEKSNNIVYFEGGLESAQIPVSFYIINYTNNILSYSIQNGLTITNYSITLNVGNYDYKTLFTEMKAQFLSNGHTFNLAISNSNGRITLTYVPVSTEYFLRINSNSTCQKIIGLEENLNYNATANVLNCVFPLNLLGIKKLKIFVDEFVVNNLDSLNFTTTNLIQTIPNDAQPWGLISFNNIDTQYPILKNVELNKLTISITDEYDNYVNFNGIDWTLTLVFYLYKKNEFKEIQNLNSYAENLPIEEQIQELYQPQQETQQIETNNLNATDELNNNPIYTDLENIEDGDINELNFLANF